MTDVSTAEARRNLAELLNRVAYGGERLVVTRHGKQLAAIVPLEDLSLLDRLRNAVESRDVAKALVEHEVGESIEWSALRSELGLDR